MLAIGGVIGVGLFYGASLSVQMAGPAVVLVYLVFGLLTALVMRALGEMTVDTPVSGSFSHYAAQYLGKRVGFVTGGMWWFYWVATVMSELAGIGKLVEFWFPSFPAYAPGIVALVLFTVSNLFAVKVFGEVEYWFAVLKILAIAVFMVFGVLIIAVGTFNHGHPAGFSNLWQYGGFAPHGWIGVFAAASLVIQAYSGVETLAVEAGESKNPKTNMPKAFRRVSMRILVLYVGSIFIMLAAFPWTYLIHHSGSPYVLMFAKAGVPIAATVVNLLIIFSGLSSCNTGLYGGSRMLYSLATRDQESTPSTKPGLENKSRLTKLNKNQVPHAAVWVTALMISIGILITYLAPNNVYIWITSASAFASLWTWGIVFLSEFRFRTLRQRSGQRPQFAMPWWPAPTLLGMALLLVGLAAMVISPYTRVSVLSGVVFLAALWLYAWRRVR